MFSQSLNELFDGWLALQTFQESSQQVFIENRFRQSLSTELRPDTPTRLIFSSQLTLWTFLGAIVGEGGSSRAKSSSYGSALLAHRGQWLGLASQALLGALSGCKATISGATPMPLRAHWISMLFDGGLFHIFC